MKNCFALLLLTSLPLIAHSQSRVSSNDLMSDDFEVLRALGKHYVHEAYPDANLGQVSDFGLNYRSYAEDLAYPKVGFIGFDLGQNQSPVVVKLQLFKGKNGWGVERELEAGQIDQAHPFYLHKTDHQRSYQGQFAQAAAAQVLERWLVSEGRMNNVRSTAMDCYLTKSANAASCHGIYGVKVDGETKCETRSYLVEQGSAWQVIKPIQFDQEVNYQTGALKTRTPFTTHCN